ncbi:hypothetical protein T492DRAFT_194134 [Pavlovales sp. CCMP2436]|nr:hypothetical protein T492DRAFT_194134 [Pavlovales sp. CCMP2436]
MSPTVAVSGSSANTCTPLQRVRTRTILGAKIGSSPVDTSERKIPVEVSGYLEAVSRGEATGCETTGRMRWRASRFGAEADEGAFLGLASPPPFFLGLPPLAPAMTRSAHWLRVRRAAVLGWRAWAESLGGRRAWLAFPRPPRVTLRRLHFILNH